MRLAAFAASAAACCCAITSAFLYPQPTSKLLLPASCRQTTSLFQADPFKSLLAEDDRNSTELKRKVEQAVQDFDNLVNVAIKTKSQRLVEEVAVAVVKMLTGHWELSVTTTMGTSTSQLMDRNAQGIAQVSASLGLNVSSDQLKGSRLRVQSTVEAGSYPKRLQTKLFLADAKFAQFYGQLRFDLVKKKVAYTLDELDVLGVAIDLNSTIIKEAAAEVLQVTMPNGSNESSMAKQESSSDDVEETNESVSIRKRIKSIWKRLIKSVSGKSKDEKTTLSATGTQEDTATRAADEVHGSKEGSILYDEGDRQQVC